MRRIIQAMMGEDEEPEEEPEQSHPDAAAAYSEHLRSMSRFGAFKIC